MILCCGEALIDMIPDQTGAGEDCLVPKVGGAVFNTSIALGRLGSQAGLFTGVSRDLFGRQIEAELKASQVSTDHLARFDRPCSLAFVSLSGGQATYTFYTRDAADTSLTPENCPAPEKTFEAMFFGGISLCTDPTATTLEGLMRDRAESTVMMMDPNIRPGFITDETAYRARIAAMMRMCDIVKLSDEDLAWLVPGDLSLAQRVQGLNAGGGIVLITRGAEGAQAYVGAELLLQAPAIRAEVVDTVGAGDTFNAGVLHSLSQAGALSKGFCADPSADTLANALALAAQAAAVTVSRKGANPPWAAELSAA